MRPTRSARPTRKGNPWPLIIGALVITAGISAAAVVVSNDRRAAEERRAHDQATFEDIQRKMREAEAKAADRERTEKERREAVEKKAGQEVRQFAEDAARSQSLGTFTCSDCSGRGIVQRPGGPEICPTCKGQRK